MTKVCERIDPENITQEQRDERKNICSNVKAKITKEPEFPGFRVYLLRILYQSTVIRS